jgi:hypothetical protein
LVVSPFAIVLLLATGVLLVAAYWPRIAGIAEARAKRDRVKRKSRLRVVDEGGSDHDEFARSVERDLAALPTIDEHEPRR